MARSGLPCPAGLHLRVLAGHTCPVDEERESGCHCPLSMHRVEVSVCHPHATLRFSWGTVQRLWVARWCAAWAGLAIMNESGPGHTLAPVPAMGHPRIVHSVCQQAGPALSGGHWPCPMLSPLLGAPGCLCGPSPTLSCQTSGRKVKNVPPPAPDVVRFPDVGCSALQMRRGMCPRGRPLALDCCPVQVS